MGIYDKRQDLSNQRNTWLFQPKSDIWPCYFPYVASAQFPFLSSGVGNSPEIGNLLGCSKICSIPMDPRRTIFCAFTVSIGGSLVMIVGLHHCLMMLMSCHAWCFCVTNLRLICFKPII